jgi:hypothetical protein
MIAICFGLVGAFYMLGGYAVMRAMAMDRLIDKAIEGITLSGGVDATSRKDRLRNQFLGAMAFVSFAGGAFLFFQSAIAPVLFCSSLLMQALYTTVLAPRYFDTEEDDDEESASGRRATINAMLIYLVVTAILLLVQYGGVLPPLPPAWSQREAAALFLTIAFGIYAVWLMRSSSLSAPSEHAPLSSAGEAFREWGATDNTTLSDMAELRVQAVQHEGGLWVRYVDDESWYVADPLVIGLSVDLDSKISHWEDCFHGFWDIEDFADDPNWSDAEKEAHFDQALEIGRMIKREVSAKPADEIRVTWVNQHGKVLEV